MTTNKKQHSKNKDPSEEFKKRYGVDPTFPQKGDYVFMGVHMKDGLPKRWNYEQT